MSDLRYRLRTAAVEAEAFYHSDVADLFSEANARVGALEAEVERLREALRAIRDQEWTENALDPQWPGRTARAALAADKETT